MERFRLRFLLQEFDLPMGVTLIGRGLDCHVTIEDPLVSRQHARVIIDESGARVEDLGSRNGVRLNGQTVRGIAKIADGDRLRIGTQDFVFCKVSGEALGHARTTGVLRLCAACKLPYPREMAACPNCEATETTEDETLSGKYSTERRRTWEVELALEAFERALALSRPADAERILRRSTLAVEEAIQAAAPVPPEALEPLALAAVKMSQTLGTPDWIVWALGAYGRAAVVPSPRFAEWMQVRLPSQKDPAVAHAVRTLVERLMGATQSAEDAPVFARLVRLANTMGVPSEVTAAASVREPSDQTAEWVELPEDPGS